MKIFITMLTVMLVLTISSISFANDITWADITWNDDVDTVIKKINDKGITSKYGVAKLERGFEKEITTYKISLIIPLMADKKRYSKLKKVYVSRDTRQRKGNFADVKSVTFSGNNDNVIKEGNLFFGYDNNKLLAIKFRMRTIDKGATISSLSKKYGPPTATGNSFKWTSGSRTLYFAHRNDQQIWLVYVNEDAMKMHLKNIDDMIAKDKADSSSTTSSKLKGF